MQPITPEDRQEDPGSTCPHLGMAGDSRTHYSYPNLANCCYKAQIPAQVSLAHQESVCLTTRAGACPVLDDKWKGLHSSILIRHSLRRSKERSLKVFLGSVFAILPLMIGMMLFVKPVLFFQPPGALTAVSTPPTAGQQTGFSALPAAASTLTPRPTPTQAAPTQALTAAHTGTFTPQPAPTQTLLPTQTPLPTLTPGPALYTPFGYEPVYVLHKVRQGESLYLLAVEYGTTVEVIKAANIEDPLRSVLWADSVLVILPGQKDVTGVVRLQVIYLDEQTTLQDLSQAFGVSHYHVRFYNDLGSGEVVPGGRWLILPVQP